MTPLLSVLLGLVLGFLGVGLPTLRTIEVMEGAYIKVFGISLLSTGCLFVFTNMVVLKNIPFMIANGFGAAFSVSLIAYRRKKNDQKINFSSSISSDDIEHVSCIRPPVLTDNCKTFGILH